MTSITDAPPAQRRAAYGLALVLTAQLMLILDAAVINVALPLLRADLGFSPANLSWVLNAYSLAFGGLLLFGGRLGDVIGRLRAFEIGLGIFTFASLLGGLAQDPAMLIASRALQGVGAAIAAPSVLALITAGAPDESQPQPRPRAVQRGVVGRRLDRADPRRRPDRLRLVALVPVHQRADRHHGRRARAALRPGDDSRARPLRRAGRDHGDRRLGRPGVRLHQRSGPQLVLEPARSRRSSPRRSCSDRSPASSAGRGSPCSSPRCCARVLASRRWSR